MLRVSVNALKIKASLKFAAAGLRNPAPVATIVGSNLSTKRAFSSEVPQNGEPAKAKSGLWNKYFGLESNIAREGFNNRWLMVVPAFFTHMSIGSTWAWSIMADAVSREKGFVSPAFSDWTLLESAYPLSIVFLTLGVSASLVGKWQMKVGARQAIATAAAFFGGGCLAGAAGIHFHSLPLLYAGYGVMAGSGLGLAYTPPVQTLMQWFPDKKGVASGLTIAGFGSGALVFTPCVQYLMDKFHKLPEYLGPAQNFVTQVKDGRLFADVNGSLVEVVSAGAAELAKIPYTLSEGLYVVGSGSTGATEALAVMGGTYFTVMMAAALAFKKPHPTYVAPVAAVTTKTPVAPVNDITLEQAMRQPQFYLLGTTFTCLATGGMGMFSVAKPLMSEVFSAALPAVVTSAFAAKFILMLSAGNLGGRIMWAAVSDAIGRRNTFMIFTAGSIPLYFFLPTLVDTVLSTGSSVPLYAYCASSALAISIMGGTYAILPAYESDLFGTKFVGAVHGRMMLFSSIAALAGPTLLLNLRAISEKAAITDLLTKVSPESFQATFGAPMESAMELLAAKSLNISKLLALCPPGTLDPTPHLYDTTMYAMSGLTALAFVAHGMVRPLPQTPVAPTAGMVIDVPAPAAAAVSEKVTEIKEVKEAEVGDRQVNK